MKIVILDGSHDKKGMTSLLIKNFVDGIKSVNSKAEIIQYDLLNEKIQFCKGCNRCMKQKAPINAKCSIDDVAISIKEEALNCDVVVFASPIYELCVSSSMKRFLERCATLITFKFGVTSRAKAIKGKYGVVLCSSGAPVPFNYLFGITRYPKMILKLACKLFRCSKTKTLFAGGMRMNNKFKIKWANKAKKLGIEIANNCK